MEHSLNPILHVVNPKIYEGRFSPYTCGIGLSMYSIPVPIQMILV